MGGMKGLESLMEVSYRGAELTGSGLSAGVQGGGCISPSRAVHAEVPVPSPRTSPTRPHSLSTGLLGFPPPII